ncbi:unnamed protein product, partial [Didymodactylos carnosus]
MPRIIQFQKFFSYSRSSRHSSKLFALATVIAILFGIPLYSICRQRPLLSTATTIAPLTRHPRHPNCNEYDTNIRPQDIFQTIFRTFTTEEWLQKPSYFSVTYSQLHTALFGNQAQNIYKQWTNNYAKKADHTYGFSGLTSEYFSTLINNGNLSIPLHFIVEVGSFM